MSFRQRAAWHLRIKMNQDAGITGYKFSNQFDSDGAPASNHSTHQQIIFSVCSDPALPRVPVEIPIPTLMDF